MNMKPMTKFADLNSGDILVRWLVPSRNSSNITVAMVSAKTPRELFVTPVDLRLLLRTSKLSDTKFVGVTTPSRKSIISHMTIAARHYFKFDTQTEFMKWAKDRGYLVPAHMEQLKFQFNEMVDESVTLETFSARVTEKVCMTLNTDGHLARVIAQCSRDILHEMNTLKKKK